MKKGFVVIEVADDYEQILCLKTCEGLPPKGILDWHEEGEIRHVFPSHADARKAIQRTHHYSKAYGLEGLPGKSDCRIQPVKIQEE